tara:strand:+ start:446 stop:634 length:189 start_codon:yes stop_codon:yes gene_type:complete
MSQEKFGKIFNYIEIDGGFLIHLFTFIKFGGQITSDENGGYIQLTMGLIIFNSTLTLWIDNK